MRRRRVPPVASWFLAVAAMVILAIVISRG
jgi:hypothetical protein